jgi:uncharacterized membrane protein
MRMVSNLRESLAVSARPATVFAGLSAFAVLLLFFALGSLVPGYSQSELSALQASGRVSDILHNPVFLPHKLALFLIESAGQYSPWATRAVSALLGLVIIMLFYRIARQLFTARMAILATLLFASSTWMLQVMRMATPEVAYLFALALVWCGLQVRNSQFGLKQFIVCGLVCVLLIYTPGMALVVIALLLWQSKSIAKVLARQPLPVTAGVLCGMVILLMPLLYGLVLHPNLLLTLAGLPDHLGSLSDFGLRLAHVPYWLFIRGPAGAGQWYDKSPVFDLFSAAMIIIGLYALAKQYRLDRTIVIFVFLLLGSVLVALNGPVTFSIMVPFMYLLIAAGISLLLDRWFSVFPRNPLAHNVGATLLTVGILLAGFYQISHYFIAWPNTPATKAAFNLRVMTGPEIKAAPPVANQSGY